MSGGKNLTKANMNNENVYDPNWYMVKNEVDGCLDKICGKLDVLKTSARNLMDVAKNIVFEEKGCFKYGTLVKKQTNRGWSLIPIEEVQFGDVLECCDKFGEKVEAPIAYVYEHHHDWFDVVTFTVTSGKTVSTSTNHMMTVWTTDGKMELKPAYQVKVGDIFYT